MSNHSSSHPTDPNDVLAAQAQAERLRRAELEFDDELIRRMEEGPMIDASEVDRNQVRERALRIAVSQGGPPVDSDQYRRARLELDEKIIEGLQGPFLTEEEWHLKLEEMRNSIPRSPQNAA